MEFDNECYDEYNESVDYYCHMQIMSLVICNNVKIVNTKKKKIIKII